MKVIFWLAIALFLLLGVACGPPPPPGGEEAYCYRILYDPRGDHNDVDFLTNSRPIILEGGAVVLREVWARPGRSWDYEDEVILISGADTMIINRCYGQDRS